LIDLEDTGGVELTWSNDDGIIEMLHLIGKREGFGDLLADGMKVAAEKIDAKNGDDRAQEFRTDVGGQELPMHDAKLQPEYWTTYKLDPTPARHTQYEGNSRFGGPEYPAAPRDFKDYANRGEHHKGASEYMHISNSTGMCQFIMMAAPTDRFPQWINAVTGWDLSGDDLQLAGERIANLRMAFTVREGDNPRQRFAPPRLWGGEGTVQKTGPLADVILDIETLETDFLNACDWDTETCLPSREKLESIGLSDVADALAV
ncbi:MAG: hypothetical protein OXH38_07845, partial [Chloroflexi bacterium]|nr:hypothetical protein [Chloroflexota bacterium]